MVRKISLKRSSKEIGVIKGVQVRLTERRVWTLDAFIIKLTFLLGFFQRLHLFVAGDSEFISVGLNLSASDRHHPRLCSS